MADSKMDVEKINKLMAERVMGFRKEGHALHGPFWVAGACIIEQSKWNPATDLNDAIAAINFLATQHSYWNVGRHGQERIDGLTEDSQPMAFVAEVNIPERGLTNAFSNTAARAICLCCLRAVGVDIGE